MTQKTGLGAIPLKKYWIVYRKIYILYDIECYMIKDKIKTFPTYLKESQIKWIDKQKSFKIHLFFRKQLDDYIQWKTQLKELGN